MVKLRWMAGVLAACAAVAGCVPRTDLSAAASVPPQYTHVWVTIQALWFNTSDTATPVDSTWKKFSLDKPITVDLASLTGGDLTRIASDLKVPSGTYRQIRLLPVDETAALTASARDAGADFNSEVDFTDSAGKSQQLRLEILNPEQGIGVQTSIKLKADNNASLQSSKPLSLAFALDGMHDLVRFNYGDQTGVVLSAHAAVYDVAKTGTIQGTIDLTDIGGSIGAGGQVNVSVTAEVPSEDSTRYTAVKTAPVASNGSFVLYPLPTDADTPTSYDVVIHGPGIATVIIKSVPVSVGDPASTAVASVGTIRARPAESFLVNLTAGSQTAQSGALIDFYQTLPQAGELPYLIDQVPLDPFSRTLFEDHPLSLETIDFGTYADGNDVALTTAIPLQGAGVYTISAQSPLFAAGVLTDTVAAPGGGAGTVQTSVRALKQLSGSTAGTIALTVFPLTAGKYDRGEAVVSHDGAIIQTLAIDSALTQATGATLSIGGLPGGADEDFYYVSARVWNSKDPDGTLHRQSGLIPADLRAGGNAVAALLIN